MDKNEIQKLRAKIEELEEFIIEHRHIFSAQSSVIVTGSLNTKPIKPVDLDRKELINVYNDIPQILNEYARGVNLSTQSYRSYEQEPIFLKELPRSNYWVIATKEEEKLQYWLFPNGNIRIDVIKVDTIRRLFNLHGSQPNNTSEYIVTKPAVLSIMPNGQEWKLEQKGILYLGKKDISNQTKTKEEMINDDDETSWSILDELIALVNWNKNRNYHLRKKFAQLIEENNNLKLKVLEINQQISEIKKDRQNYFQKNKKKTQLLSLKKYAGFWRRFFAFCLDLIPLNIIFFNIYIDASFLYDYLYFDFDFSKNLAVTVTALFIIIGSILSMWFYFCLMESSKFQGSIGKIVMRIKVTDLKERRISFGKASRRFSYKLLPVINIISCFFRIAFDNKKQGLHDKKTGCLVLLKRNKNFR